MSRVASIAGWRVAGAAALALAGLLTGCAAPPAGQADRREPQTASDETDATRRARVRLELAAEYFAQGQTTTALDEVKQALAANANFAEAYNLRGLIYAQLGEDALADESFRRALQINPRDADTLHNYGWYQCQQRRFAEAQKLFTQALDAPQQGSAARTLLVQGVCLARAGEWVNAERTLQKAFELEPGNAAIAVNLAEVLYRREEYERARFYIRRVLGQPDGSTAQTLWLAIRIENRAGNEMRVKELGTQLRNRFPQSREAAAFERGQFDG
jgi:type IV pilus assembly protein PilF